MQVPTLYICPDFLPKDPIKFRSIQRSKINQTSLGEIRQFIVTSRKDSHLVYRVHISVRSSFVAVVADFSHLGSSKMENKGGPLPVNILIAFAR